AAACRTILMRPGMTAFECTERQALWPSAADAGRWPDSGDTPCGRLAPDDEDGRADLDALEEPLGVRDAHADAAMRGRVADRGGIRSPVDAYAGRREAHPPCAEWVARARRDRARPRSPRRVGRVPPGVLLLRDDRELPDRRRIDRLPDRDAEASAAAHVRPLVEVELM